MEIKNEDFPEVEIVEETLPHEEKRQSERLTQEELNSLGLNPLLETFPIGKKTIKIFIFTLAGILGILLIAGFWALGLDVSETLVIYSQGKFIPSEEGAIRVAFIDDAKGFIPIESAIVTLRNAEKKKANEAILFSGMVGFNDAGSIVMKMPDWEPGHYLMKVSARAGKIEKSAVFSLTLDPLFEGSPYSTSITSATEKVNKPEFFDTESGIRIELLPENYVLASSLHNLIYVRTTDATGKPVKCRVGLKLASGYINGSIPDVITTDSAGLSAFMIYPAVNFLSLSVSLLNEEGKRIGGEGVIDLPVEPRIFRLRASRPWAKEGEKMDLRLFSINRSNPYYLDIYRNGIWIYADGGYLNSFSTQISIPAPEKPGIITLQVYGSPSYVGKGVSSIHVLIGKQDEKIEDAIKKVARMLIEENIDAQYASLVLDDKIPIYNTNAQMLLAMLLSRLDKGFYEPKIFYTTRKTDEKAIANIKNRIKRTIIISLCAVSGIFAVAVLFMMALALRLHSPFAQKYKINTTTAINGETFDENHHDYSIAGGETDYGMGTRKFFIALAFIAAIIAAFFGLLAILFTYLKWTFVF